MFKGKKKSVIVGWVCSYLIILLIPIISIFINYYYNVRVIRNEIIRANEQILNNLGNSIDELLEDQKAFYSFIYTNEAFSRLMIYQEKGAQFYYDVSRLRDALEDYCDYNEGLSSLLYFVDKDYVINTSGANESEYFYQSLRFYNPDMQEYDAWKKEMTAEYNYEFQVRTFMHHKTTEECIVYAGTLDYYKDNKVNLFISIPVKTIISMAKSVEAGSQFLITMDGEPILAISNGEIVEPAKGMKWSEQTQEYFEMEEYVGLCKDSGNKGVSYCLLIMKNEFWKEARDTKNVLSISISIALIMGFVCTTFLVRRNFQPVSNLLDKMGGKKMQGDEFLQIEQLYNNLIVRNQSMNERILDQDEIIKRNALLKLMKGRCVEMIKEGDYINPDKNEEIRLVGFEIPLNDSVLIQHDELLHFTLDNIFSELMMGDRFYRIEDGQFLFYLFVIPKKNRDSWKKKCMEKTNFLCDFTEEKFGLVPTVAVSKPEKELQSIRFQYQDVMEAFEFKSIIGGKGAIDIEMLNFESNTVSICTSDGELIKRALAKGDLSELMEVLEQFFARSKRLPLLIFRMQVMGIFQTVAQNFFDFEEGEDRRMYLLGYLKPLLNATEKEETRKILEEVLNYVYGVMHEQDQVGNKGIVAYIREYVETHYTDSTLNISTIANSMGKNPKYIARVFKNETQEGILDYINDIRISKAVVLLSSGKYSVEEISEKVGYSTVKTFRRTFSKMKGVTPGKFEA